MSSRNRTLFLFFSTALLTLMALPLSGRAGAQVRTPPHSGDGDGKPPVYQEVVFGYRADKTTPAKIAQAVAYLGTVIKTFPQISAVELRLKPAVTPAAALQQLKLRADVRYAENNGTMKVFATPAIPNDTYYGNQYAPRITHTESAWARWQPKAQKILALIDTGVDSTHPDLINKILLDGSGNVKGYDATIAMPGPGKALDKYGHGTHCAGIAAAQVNNGKGVAGVAGWDGKAGDTDADNIKIMPVKVLGDDGSGLFTWVASGIMWSADNGADVLSMSIGGYGPKPQVVQDAINYAFNKGCLIVAAAGNAATNEFSWPGACDNVISVAATDGSDTLTYFSNWGDWVKVAAPGLNIFSTLPTTGSVIQKELGLDPSNPYGYLSGTSMACPFVAGEALLLWSSAPSLTNKVLTKIILNNVDPYFPFYPGTFLASGAGRVNVDHAYSAAHNLNLLLFSQKQGQIALVTLVDGVLANSQILMRNISTDWNLVGVGDMNGDRTPDFVWQNSKTGEVWTSLLKYDDTTQTYSTLQNYWIAINVPSNLQVIGLMDFLSKGSSDLLWRDTKTGDVDYSTMDYASIRINGSGTLYPALPASYQLLGTENVMDPTKTGLTWYDTAKQVYADWLTSGVSLKLSQVYTDGATPPATYVPISLLNLGADNTPFIVYRDSVTGSLYDWATDGSNGSDPLLLLPNLTPDWNLMARF